MGDKGVLLSTEWERRLRKMWGWTRNFKATGPGVTFKNSEDNCSLVLTPPAGPPQRTGTDWPLIVQVTKDGGSDGNASTAASWTYTVKDEAGTNTLGTGVTLYRARAKGPTTYATDGSYGLAKYIGGTLYLLDAYKEVHGTAAC